MPERPDGASRYQKTILERPEAVSHYENAGWRVRERFALEKMQAAARASRKCLFYRRKTIKKIWRLLGGYPPFCVSIRTSVFEKVL